MYLLRRIGLSLILVLWASGAWAACATTSLTFKDAGGATQTLCFGGSAGQFIGQSSITDNSGNIIGATSNALDINIKSGSIANTAFIANAGTNLNTSLLALEGGGNLATLAGAVSSSKFNVNISSGNITGFALESGGNLAQSTTDFGAPGATACATDTSSCNFNQLFQRIAQRLTTINTTLGSPFQAGGALAANQSVNVAQVNGVATQVNTGAVGTGSQRVAVGTDTATIAGSAPGTQDVIPMGCAGQTIANTTYTPFTLASTTSLKLVTKVSAKKVYICSINIVSAAANNVALIEGTKVTTDCDTSTAGLAGGTTAATGWNFAANGGLTLGNGQGIIAKSGTANFDVCLLASGSGQLSGGITWAQF